MTGRLLASVAPPACALLLAVLAPARSTAQDEGVDAARRVGMELSAGAVVEPAAPVFEVSASRFLGDLVRLGVRQEGGVEPSSDDGAWHLATLPFLDLHLASDPKPVVTPFVGLAAGVLYDDRRATAALGPEAGVQVFLGEQWYLTLRWQYRWAGGRVGGLERESHLATLGVGFLLPTPVDTEALRAADEAAARAERAALEAERAVERLEKAVERLERAVDEFAVWFEQQLRKQ